jgi:hypothetical protein
MNRRARNGLLVALAIVIAFGIGAGWQFVRASQLGGELETTRQQLAATSAELELQKLEATLGAATIEAQRNGYELGRQLASDFFTGLQESVGGAPEAARAPLNEILAQRDEVITALSRSNAEAGSLLARLFIRYRVAMGEQVGPQTLPAADSAAGVPPTGGT